MIEKLYGSWKLIKQSSIDFFNSIGKELKNLTRSRTIVQNRKKGYVFVMNFLFWNSDVATRKRTGNRFARYFGINMDSECENEPSRSTSGSMSTFRRHRDEKLEKERFLDDSWDLTEQQCRPRTSNRRTFASILIFHIFEN